MSTISQMKTKLQSVLDTKLSIGEQSLTEDQQKKTLGNLGIWDKLVDYGNKLVDYGTKIEGILNSIAGINNIISSHDTNINSINSTINGIYGSDVVRRMLTNVTSYNSVSAIDYNNLTTPGMYYVDGANPYQYANAPGSGITNSFILVLRQGINNNRVTQIAFPGNESHIWYRSKLTDRDSWYAWKMVGSLRTRPINFIIYSW